MTAVASQLPPPGGDIEGPFQIADYVQLACMGRRSVQVVLRRRGRPVGRVQIFEGQLWSARDHMGAGEPAFGRLMFLRNVSTAVSSLEEDDLEERSLYADWQHVLLEAARRHDEATASASGVRPRVTVPRPQATSERTAPRGVFGAPSAVPAPALELVAPPPPPAEPPPAEPPPALSARPPAPPVTQSFEEAYEAGVEALLDRRFGDAHRAFSRAERARPGDRSVQANLRRLSAMGYGEGGDGA